MACERTSDPFSPRKRRQRSPTPSSPSSTPKSCDPFDSDGDDDRQASSKRRRTDLSVEVCKDFTRNLCKRPEIDCKFAHPHSAVTIDDQDRVTACADALRNKCFRGRTCRYYHPPPHIQQLLLKASGVQSPKLETVCRDFMRGLCVRGSKECRFAHHTSIDHCSIVCQDFVRGRCERKSCRYSHVLVHEISQARLQHHRTSLEPPTRPRNDQEILQVCKDFLKKMCKRDSCKFAHPNSETKVIDNQVEICRDFRRGKCQRTVCRFYHPSMAKTTI